MKGEIMSELSISSLKDELHNIQTSDQEIKGVYENAKLVDLEEVGVMLANVERQISDLNKTKSFISRIGDKLPIIGNIKKKAEKELATQQEITTYVTKTLGHFDEKYDELVVHLKNFDDMREKFSDDIIKLDAWVKKAMAYKEQSTDISEKAVLDKLLTDAKSEIKRKVDTLKSLIEPMIIAATYQTRMINELTPILKNMLYAELKTMVGVNSFKHAANMMIALKESIIEIQKLNIQNTNEAIVDILKSTKTNLLSAKDFDDMDKLREKQNKEIENTVSDIFKLQEENKKFMDKVYNDFQANGTLKIENLKKRDNELLIEAIPEDLK
jgi:hypothetical protein